MNITQFNNILYNGNINIQFYLYCLKKDFKLIIFIFINIWYFIISCLFSSKKDLYIIKKYEDNKKDDVPYYSFSVTYQNHGPYSSENYDDKKYFFENDGRYDDKAYNIINEYLNGIYSTNQSLEKLINYFDNEKEPVIIIFFGDHNPYIGDSGFSEMGVNMDLATEEGFLNYYETPYVIHANDSAKTIFGKSFIGEGNTISPIFLMNELFDYCGIGGNEYLQYMSDLKDKIDVINQYYYKENGLLVRVDESDNEKIIREL